MVLFHGYSSVDVSCNNSNNSGKVVLVCSSKRSSWRALSIGSLYGHEVLKIKGIIYFLTTYEVNLKIFKFRSLNNVIKVHTLQITCINSYVHTTERRQLCARNASSGKCHFVLSIARRAVLFD